MKTKMFIPLLALAYLSTFTTFHVAQLSAAPLGTAFNYQGHLTDGANPADGIYDLRFATYDALTGPSQIGSALTNAATGVSNGLFTVTLDFGAGVFDGNARWLEIGVRTNGGGGFTTLAPRQALTPSPYALYAPSAGTMSGNPVVSGTTTFSPVSGPPFLVSNTNKVVNLSADLLDGLDSSAFWRTAGNAGTTPGLNFFGTTDNQPLEFKVNNQRVLRVENSGTSPNFVGGFSGNSVGANVYGATLSGGGQPGNINSADAICSTIGGGYGNAIRTNAASSTIGGGALNGIGTNAHSSVIGGGAGNNVAANAAYGTIAGGVNNNIGTNSGQGTIGGGWTNTIGANSSRAAIAGGEMNKIGTNCYASTIGGGTGNTIADNSDLATIPGGGLNYAGHYAFAAGLRARASHNGTFVWGDTSTGDVIASTGNNQFLIRAAGGVGIGTNNPQSALHVNGTVTATAFSGDGAGLTSAGLLKASVLNVNVVGGVDYPTTYVKVGDLGSFTKLQAGSTIEITFDGRLGCMTMTGGGALFELRIDDTASTVGWARATLKPSEVGAFGNQTSITGIFTGLGTGSHTVNMWVAGGNGSGTGAYVAGGNYSTDHVVVKELK
jgi:hypothetical protein